MADNRQNENWKRNGKDNKNTKYHSRRLSKMIGTLRHRSRTLRSYPSRSDESAPSLNRRNDFHSSQNSTPTLDEPFEMIPKPSKTIVDVNSLTDEEVRERITPIMDDIFQENERKATVSQQLTIANMRTMLSLHLQREDEEIADAEYQIQCLNHFTIDNIDTKNSKETFEHVAFSLKKYSLKWSKIFGENLNGPNAMLKAMRACITKVQITQERFNPFGNEQQISLQEILGAGIEAFRNYFNLGWNFNSMTETLAKNIAEITIDVLNILSLDSDERSIKIKSSCAILLFALAMPNENNPSNGQNIVELLSQSAKKWYGHQETFHCLVHELNGSIEVASRFLMCINAIFVTLTTEQRYHLRTGLFRSGFKTCFEELQRRVLVCQDLKQKENLSIQIELFLRHIDLDYQAMNIKFDSISESWANLQSCFDYLYGLVKGSQSESLLLCIISRIICIRDDQAIRYSYLHLIDQCIQRIVFSKTACDPDFDNDWMDGESSIEDSNTFIPVGSLHDHLSQMDEQNAKKNLQATENQIQFDLMKGRVEHLERTREKLTKALKIVLTKIDAETADSLTQQYLDITPSPESTAVVRLPSPKLTTDVSIPPPELPRDVSTPRPELPADVSVPPPELTTDVPATPSELPADVSTPPPPELTTDVSIPPPELTTDVSTPPPELPADVSTPPPKLTTDVPASPPKLTTDVSTLPSELPADVSTPPPELTTDVSAPPPELTTDVSAPPAELTTDVSAPPAELTTNAPSPPPPPPFLNVPPPPPPFLSGPPPIGTIGGGGPPPPPFLLGPPPLPEYLREKQQYDVGEAVKKVTWNMINPQSIKRHSIWTNIDEKNCQNKTFFTSIKENFAAKTVPVKKTSVHSGTEPSTTSNTIKEFRVLDPRVGHNFGIIFIKLKSNPQEFRQWFFICDSERLTSDLLIQLNKYLPSSDELKKFSALKNEINDLLDSEQYFCAISDVQLIQQRIRILLFKSEYKELLEGIETKFVTGQQACETVHRSKRFPKLIELVLTIGNYMNSCDKNYKPIHGFDISFLPKLHNTKSNDGKRTLLHFVLQEIEQDHEDLLEFSNEFEGIAELASKIDITELQAALNSIKVRVNNAQTDLDTAKKVLTDSTSEDLFVQTTESFVKAAQDDIERLETLNIKMTNTYQDLCDYLSIDSKKRLLNEFFMDLKTFCTLFITCLHENRLWRQQDENKQRAQISKKRAEPETFFKPNDKDTDVVSNLMSVLKDANVSSQPRRVRRPPASLSRDVPVVS